MPGTEGLVHISELKHGRTEKTEDVVKKGDRVKVKLLDRDERGRLRLSMKALLPKPEGMTEDQGDGGRGGRGGRGSERPRRPGGDEHRHEAAAEPRAARGGEGEGAGEQEGDGSPGVEPAERAPRRPSSRRSRR
jgi:polyribonucleotide nucleotidyltransferase